MKLIGNRNPGVAFSNPATQVAAIALLTVTITACAARGGGMLQRADQEAGLGNWDAAVTYYQRVLQDQPGDVETRSKLERARLRASQAHTAEAQKLREAGDLERALLEFELAVRLDGSNQHIAEEFRRLEQEVVAMRQAQEEGPTALEEAVKRSLQARSPIPQLEPQVEGPISLDFRRARIQEVYRALGQLGGVNILFGADLRNPSTSVNIADSTFLEALDVLTVAHGHFAKVLTPTTLLLLEDNQNNRNQYDDNVIRTFYLSNAEAEVVANTLQTMLSARSVAPDTTLNTVTVRDTPEVLEVAERIIAAADKSRGEVLLQIEVFEVNKSLAQEYGFNLLPFSSFGGVSGGSEGISVNTLGQITQADLFVTIPSVRFQFFKEHNDFKLIAEPQLRASEGQQTTLLIGQRVPIISTTFNPQNTSGGDIIPISSTTYENVGIEIAVQPRVHHNNEVTLALEIAISSVIGESSIQNLPIFSSRTLSTTIRLRDGETNLLAGLLRDDERTRLQGVPGLSDIPLLGKLFSTTKTDIVQTDIILSITPHLIRTAEITDEDLKAIYVGSSGNVQGRAGRRGRSSSGDDETSVEEEARPSLVVQLAPANATVSVGQRVNVDVRLDGDGDVFNAGVRIGFDSTVLRYISATEGDLLSGDGAETTFTADGGAGASPVSLGITRIGNVGPVTGVGRLSTLVFEAVAPGEATVEIQAAAVRGVDGRPLALRFEPSTVRVMEE